MSFGKTYSLTGYRAGLLLASERLIHHALKAQDTMVVCQPRITQLALAFAADNLDSWVAGNARMMAKRHERFCAGVCHPGQPVRTCCQRLIFRLGAPSVQRTHRSAGGKEADR